MCPNHPLKGVKPLNFHFLDLLLCIVSFCLLSVSSSSIPSSSPEKVHVESSSTAETLEAAMGEPKPGVQALAESVESSSPPAPSDTSSAVSPPPIPVAAHHADALEVKIEAKDTIEGAKSIEGSNSAFEDVSKAPDASYKFPKTKERFVPLNKWKEEKLQYVAKTLGGSPSLGIRSSEDGLSDSGPSSRTNTRDIPATKSTNEVSLETTQDEAAEETVSASLQINPLPIAHVDEHSTTHNTNINDALDVTLANSDLSKSDVQQEETPIKLDQSQDAAITSSPVDTGSAESSSLDMASNPSEEADEVLNSQIIASSPSMGSSDDVPPLNAESGLVFIDSPASEPHNPPSTADIDSSLVSGSDLPSTASIDPSTSFNSTKLHNESIKNDTKVTVEPETGNSTIGSSTSSSSSSSKSSRRRLRKNRFNFASHDCGAKVLSSNDEAVDASAVLVGSKDRYMLNPCSAPRQWIVIELCEEVGIDHIQVGNFEFFSSMIKEVQVLASHKYPSKSWALLGNFTLSNERELQSLDFGEESELFPEWFKYLKIRILSHWGNEYYCPITEIQVHGLPYVEKLEQELRQNSLELHDIEKLLSESSSVSFDAPAPTEHQSPQRIHTSHPHPTQNNSQSNHNHSQNAHAALHHPDAVMPMHEYLEQHKLKTTEYFNTIYNTLGNIDPETTSNQGKEETNQKKLNPQNQDSKDTDDKDQSYDIVHPEVNPPHPKIGGDDELDELEDDETSVSHSHVSPSRFNPLKSTSNGHEKAPSQDETSPETDKAATGGKLSPASAIPTMNLIQLIIQRVKALEISQSLASAYLGNVSAFYQEELAEIGDALGELDQRYYRLLQVVSNTSSTAQAINEAKFAALTAELQSANEFKKEVFGSLRMYLGISAALTIVICVMCSFLVVLLLRCLPNGTHERLHHSPTFNSLKLFRSNSDIALSNTSRIVGIKEDPLADRFQDSPTIPYYFDDMSDLRTDSPPADTIHHLQYSPQMSHIRHASLPAGRSLSKQNEEFLS